MLAGPGRRDEYRAPPRNRCAGVRPDEVDSAPSHQPDCPGVDRADPRRRRLSVVRQGCVPGSIDWGGRGEWSSSQASLPRGAGLGVSGSKTCLCLPTPPVRTGPSTAHARRWRWGAARGELHRHGLRGENDVGQSRCNRRRSLSQQWHRADECRRTLSTGSRFSTTSQPRSNMTHAWQDHCPFTDERDRREAFRNGWQRRTRTDEPITPKMDVVSEQIGDSELVSAWMQGYLAADQVLSSSGPTSDRPQRPVL